MNKKIVVIHETDQRFNAIDFGEEKAHAPEDLKQIFDSYESVAWRRRRHERQAALLEIMSRANPKYRKHFERRVSIVQQTRASMTTQFREQRNISVISPESLWFNNLYWFRVMLAINVLVACLWQADWQRCMSSDREKTLMECISGGR